MSNGSEFLDLESKQEPSATPMPVGHLEEYRTLRDEIMRRFTFRLLVVGYSNAFIGAGIAVAANIITGSHGTASPSITNNSALSVLAFAYVMVAIGGYFTGIHTKQIYYLAAYIRKEIEPNVPGLNWETWSKKRRLTYGASRSSAFALLIYYLGVDAGLTILCFAVGIVDSRARLIAVSGLSATVAVMCLIPLAQVVKLYGSRDREDYLVT
jgi:hypothetical protein